MKRFGLEVMFGAYNVFTTLTKAEEEQRLIDNELRTNFWTIIREIHELIDSINIQVKWITKKIESSNKPRGQPCEKVNYEKVLNIEKMGGVFSNQLQT